MSISRKHLLRTVGRPVHALPGELPDERGQALGPVLGDECARARDGFQSGVGEVALQTEGEPRGEEEVSVSPGDQDRVTIVRKATGGLERVPFGDATKKPREVVSDARVLYQGRAVGIERSVIYCPERNGLEERPLRETRPKRPREKIHKARSE